MSERTRLILAGGFLGAGKTTLLAKAAERLARAGRRVGLITNDQAANLVDTSLLEGEGASVREVSGGCFCCRFDDLIAALKGLMRGSPDIVIAEPVGSCTDLSATVLQPLKKIYGQLFRVAPFSVLVDPVRLRESLGPDGGSRFPESVTYIFRKQIEEADLVVLNKADTLSSVERADLLRLISTHLPGTPALPLSARTGEGVDAWLERILADAPAGQRIATVDYDTYAEGESVLGWLNATAMLRAAAGADWRAFALDLLAKLRNDLRARGGEVAHVKLLLEAGSGRILANLVRTDADPYVTGSISSATAEVTLVLNARVGIDPADLRATVESCLRAAAGDRIGVTIGAIESFSPARPRPTHRFDAVVPGE